jgi:hypothetical protein
MTENRKADYPESLSFIFKHGWQLALPTMLAFSICVQSAPAQFNMNLGKNKPPNPKKKKYDNNNEYVPIQLKEPPDLPFLPPYTGAVYSNILSFNRVPNKPAFTMTFHVKELPEEVIAWYKDAFKANKWAPQKGGDSAKLASGRREGAMATVMVMKPILKGYKAQVYIVYKIYGKVK